MFDKYNFYQRKIQYLGHVISEHDIAVDPEKIKAIMEWFIPKYLENMQSFMGIISFVRDDKGYSPIRFEAIPRILIFEQNFEPWSRF
jgi:hypothetical protein